MQRLILVVEDEKPILDILKFNLEKEGYKVATAEDGEEAIIMARQVNPDLIFIQKPNDYMCDHVAASHLAFDASFMATCPHYETKYPAIDKIAPIYYMGTASEVGFNPTEYVDITDVMDIKRAMCYEHKSQIQWMSDNYKDAVGDKDFLEATMIQARYRGIQCGVDYAEGFRMANDAFRVFPKRILP